LPAGHKAGDRGAGRGTHPTGHAGNIAAHPGARLAGIADTIGAATSGLADTLGMFGPHLDGAMPAA
jgi:hypothetical protein